MRRSERLMTMVGIALLSSANSAFAQWQVHTAPEFPGNTGIKVHEGIRQGDGDTIVIQKGESIKLSASAVDVVKVVVEANDILANDATEIIWTTTGGTLANNRTASGAENEFTAPNSTGTITVTVQADDKPNLANDNPGESVTLKIKVVDGCPGSISMSSSCNGTPNWSQHITFGLLVAKICVNG